MSEVIRTPKNLILSAIEDPEVKRVIEELITALYADISRLHTRIKTLEDA